MASIVDFEQRIRGSLAAERDEESERGEETPVDRPRIECGAGDIAGRGRES